jgi:hypothetical protein
MDLVHPTKFKRVVYRRPFTLSFSVYQFTAVHGKKKFQDWLVSLLCFIKRQGLSILDIFHFTIFRRIKNLYFKCE